MTDSQKFKDKLVGARVLIVGGSSGIGYSVAEGAVEHGSTVHIASSSSDKVNAAVRSLIAAYPSAKDRIKGHVVSLNDKDTVEKNVLALYNAVGEIDHLVHTAGDISNPKPTPDGKTSLFAASIDDTIAIGMVRLFAAQILIKHAPDFIPNSNRSSITITSGSTSDRPIQGYGWAASVVVGIHGLGRGAAVELAPIRVNVVSPGPVQTPIFDGLPSEQRDAMFNLMAARCLTGEIADPTDTAEAYLFLMRDRSATGSVVRNDAGMLLT